MGKENMPFFNGLTRLANTAKFTGDITTNSDIRIDGELIGNIITDNKVVLGEDGKIKGNITCKDVDIYGECAGNIVCSNLASLKKTSKYQGEIKTLLLEVEVGASINGSCSVEKSSEKQPVKSPVKPVIKS